MRKIYLPNLKHIKINDYTLYPNGLDFEYDFVNGVNLILGGNGMGKTTFVNIIKYSIIGNYKKQFDYTRTFKERKIEKRLLYYEDYFKNRMDSSIITKNTAKVIINFEINNHIFEVERDLENMILNSFSVDNIQMNGKIINQQKYEDIKDVAQRTEYLIFKYETVIEKFSGLTYDDLIFFVNEILFFGEDHKTILWNDGSSGYDVQSELINRYFNPIELEAKRQETERQAKYLDSRARHTSEEIKAIRKVLEKVTGVDKKNSSENILELKDDIEDLTNKILGLQEQWESLENKISLIQNQINQKGLLVDELDSQEKIAKNNFYKKMWEKLHPKYEIFLKTITNNHKCPMCNQPNNDYAQSVIEDSKNCFVCGSKLQHNEDLDLDLEMKKNIEKKKKAYNEIQTLQIEFKKLETEKKENYSNFKKLDSEKRKKQAILIELEYSHSVKEKPDQLQAFYNEMDELEKIKNDYLQKSKEEKEKVDDMSRQKESEVTKNVKEFSRLFSSYASQFLGVQCELTYDKFGKESNKRFYPIIDGKIRFSEEELSESQRFFVDHSFRMSVLSFFYTTPAFYIVETPDSSLDISYEKNAANVFLKFLERPNSLIITSNLNNNTFINHIIDNREINVSIIGLLDIAKQSIIQNTNESLFTIYNDIKNKTK